MIKKLLLIIALLPITLLCKADTPELIKQVVYKWNGLHNTREVSEFKKLYATEVLFYGRYYSDQKCYTQKKKFLSPDFHQEIISPIVLTYYSSGTIKCSFTKEVTFKDIVKKHQCYLLIQESEKQGHYVITGESDLETDKKLNVKLDLGDELGITGKKGNLYIVIGLLALAGGGFLYYKRKRRQPLSTYEVPAEPIAPTPAPQSVYEPQPTIVEEDIIDKVTVAVMEKMKGALPQEHPSKVKGDAFEKFVVERFKEEYFTIIDWRSDKYHNGKYAASNMLPDLVYRYQSKWHDVYFAVECKWRAGFVNGKIEWAKDYQFRNYQQYQSEAQIEVFVIIGVGGQPHEPETLYIVPLNEIYSNTLSQQQLKRFHRFGNGDFFLEANTMWLR